MIRSLFLFLSFFISFHGWAQVVTTSPTFISGSAGVIEVTFDAAQGTAGLKDYTGTVYVHTGLITSSSKNDSDWKYVLTEWGENIEKTKLTPLGNNKWKLVISPSIKEFYGVPENESIRKLAFVFRSAEKVTGEDYYLEGKDLVSGVAKDIFIDVYEPGLNVSFSLPKGNQSLKPGESLDFIVNTSSDAKIELLVNNNTVKTEERAEALSHTHTFTDRNDYVIVAKALSGTQAVYDTLYVCVAKSAEYDVRPAGVQEGINYINNSMVTFVLYAPDKENIFLTGDFNGWRQLNSYQLKKDGNYWWYALTDVDKDKLYRFQYIVDDTIRISDPYTELVLDPWGDDWINYEYERYPNLPSYPTGKADGHVATFQIDKPAYNWEVKNFTMPSKTNMVIYELLLRDFTVQQSLEAAIGYIDYLAKLGITAVELMPVQEFDGNSSWGYNPNHYFAPDKAYGPPQLYKKFIDECHKRGIAVILDVVLNHASGSHPFAKLYWNSSADKTTSGNPWFNVDAPHPYSVLHDFNHSNTLVREHFKRMLQYWIEEYKIDGYRLDLSKGITQRNSGEYAAEKSREWGRDVYEDEAVALKDDARIAYLTEYYEAAKAKNPNIMFILEHFCEWDEESALASKGMYMWKNVNNAFSQSAMGWQSDSDFGGMSVFPRNWVSYNESHDEERNFFKTKAYGAGNLKTDSVARIKRAPLNMAFATLIPGPKMIWQFGEIGYDVESGESGSDIRMEEKPSGLRWYSSYGERQDTYHATAKILNLRKQYPNAFDYGHCNLNVGYDDWEHGRRIEITHNDLNLVVVGNFKTTADAYGGVIDAYPNFPKTGTWYELLTGATISITSTGNYLNPTLQLQPGEVRIYTDRKITTPGLPEIPDLPNSIRNPQQKADGTFIYPTVTTGKVFVSTSAAVKSIAVYNMQGKLAAVFASDAGIDVSALTNGLYFIELITSEGRAVHKIVKN